MVVKKDAVTSPSPLMPLLLAQVDAFVKRMHDASVDFSLNAGEPKKLKFAERLQQLAKIVQDQTSDGR